MFEQGVEKCYQLFTVLDKFNALGETPINEVWPFSERFTSAFVESKDEQ